MRSVFITTAAAILAAVVLLIPVCAAPQTSAQSCILMDADTGRVLYESRADVQSLIASTTKIMTALVVLEHLNPQTEFQIPKEATGIEGSSMYLQPGEILTVQDLLCGMMLHSGNDAAVALALACAGSVAEFVDLMNLKAQKIGLKNTHFENPNGLDGKAHYSTARDLAKLTCEALQNETFAKIVATKTTTAAGRSLTNHNRLLWSCDGCIGVKTGYTKAAGRILVSAAERFGRRLIAVTICDGNDWNDHKQLYDYGFSLLENKQIICAGEAVAQLPQLGGRRLPLYAQETIEYAVFAGDRVRVEVIYPKLTFSLDGISAVGDVYIGRRKIAQIQLEWRQNDARTNTEDYIGSWSCLPKSR